MEQNVRLSRDQLLRCIEFGKALTAELDPNRLLERIMVKVSTLFPSENWSLLLMDEATDSLRFELSVGLDLEQVKDVRLSLGKGAAGQCALKQELLVLEDVRRYDFFHDKVDELSGYHTKSLVCLPIVFGGRTLGVLEMVNPRTLDKTSLALLSLISDYLAIAVENTRRYRKISDMAVRDGLTGLYNQRHLYRSLEALIEKCQTQGGNFSLIFMDIDNFKTIVDAQGHLNGSRTLKEVAQTIGDCLGDEAVAVAYGGDEFVVVLPGCNGAIAAKTAERIRSSISAAVYLTRWNREVRVTASLGVATYPDDADDIKALLAMADQAMFRVKHSGKDRVGLQPE
ncbi:MAG: sensor domain-containing diguanylate cyclase [Desulfobacteraceae bacterium]|nr:sensor domain-containing diguanylate cyclase [Desulfobacteraceae bacterium]